MATDSKVRIIKGGAISTTDRASASVWPFSAGAEATASYGSSSDLWGETWTAADINASTFGVALSVKGDSTLGHNANVDFIRITVYYTDATGQPTTKRFGGILNSGARSLRQPGLRSW